MVGGELGFPIGSDSSLLASARGLGGAPVHGYVGQIEADVSVVGFEHYFAQSVHRPDLDPLVAPVAERSGRALLVGDPVVGAAEHQDLKASFSKTTRSGMRERW
jgi:hypothetical protein